MRNFELNDECKILIVFVEKKKISVEKNEEYLTLIQKFRKILV